MNIKPLTEHHLEFLSLKGGCTGSSESTLVKMPHCWKSHVTALIIFISVLVCNNHLTDEERAGCFTKCMYLCLSSFVGDCGISWSSSLVFNALYSVGLLHCFQQYSQCSTSCKRDTIKPPFKGGPVVARDCMLAGRFVF